MLPDADPSLPNVFIYGDSISIHYTPYVRKDLAGKANVYRLYANGGTSSALIERMETMEKTMTDPALENPWDFQWDVIHFNVGLHDIKYMKDGQFDLENGRQMTSPEQYEKNLNAIIAYLHKMAPGATLVFATTTPVPEGSPGRVLGDEVIYNEIALKVLKQHPEVVIDDLYGLTLPYHQEWWEAPGNVHYSATGRAEQAKQVAAVIEQVLAERAKDGITHEPGGATKDDNDMK
jgi:hypothetical protein